MNDIATIVNQVNFQSVYIFNDLYVKVSFKISLFIDLKAVLIK